MLHWVGARCVVMTLTKTDSSSTGIGLFGEFFEGFEEQNALLSVLSLMTQTFNYHPAAQIAKLLRRTWFETSDDEPFAVAAAEST